MSPLARRAIRATEPQHDDDALMIQRALLNAEQPSPVFEQIRSDEAREQAIEHGLLLVVCLFVVLGVALAAEVML